MRYVIALAMCLSCSLMATDKHAVEGVVVDKDGKPLQGARLEFLRFTHHDGGPIVLPIITPRVVGVVGWTEEPGLSVAEDHNIKTGAGGMFQGKMGLGSYMVQMWPSDTERKNWGKDEQRLEHDAGALLNSEFNERMKTLSQRIWCYVVNVDNKVGTLKFQLVPEQGGGLNVPYCGFGFGTMFLRTR